MLGLPALLFLVFAFLAPIISLLGTAIANPEPRQVLPNTLDALTKWDGKAVPDEPVFAALAQDLRRANADRTAALVGKRLNYEQPGMRSVMLASARMAAAASDGPWKQRFLDQNDAWGDLTTWQVLARNAHPWTAYYLLTALDLKQTPTGGIALADPQNAIFMLILSRTLLIAAEVTALTLVFGFPVAYILATAPPRAAQVLMLFVLLPLWTSLLVRTTAWVVLLQSDGVINDTLMGLGLITHRLQLIFTRFGTVTAMVHIQLPFTILPIYSVMRGIPAAQVRAARSLGASPFAAFWRVYAPQTVPGVVAGGLITFILSLGYYITPALVGGPTDQMMSNFISTYINRDLNWGLAAALGTVLLVVTLAIYATFLRILGPERVRFG
jgi:putative spermidine/putrescine transport system permease protein